MRIQYKWISMQKWLDGLESELLWLQQFSCSPQQLIHIPSRSPPPPLRSWVPLLSTGVFSHPSDSPAIWSHMVQFTALIYSQPHLPRLCCYSSLANEKRGGGIRLTSIHWRHRCHIEKAPQVTLSAEVSRNELPQRAQGHGKTNGTWARVRDGDVGLDIVSCGRGGRESEGEWRRRRWGMGWGWGENRKHEEEKSERDADGR